MRITKICRPYFFESHAAPCDSPLIAFSREQFFLLDAAWSPTFLFLCTLRCLMKMHMVSPLVRWVFSNLPDRYLVKYQNNFSIFHLSHMCRYIWKSKINNYTYQHIPLSQHGNVFIICWVVSSVSQVCLIFLCFVVSATRGPHYS